MSDKTKRIVAVIAVILIIAATLIISLSLDMPVLEDEAKKAAAEFYDAIAIGDTEKVRSYFHPKFEVGEEIYIKPDEDSVEFLNYYGSHRGSSSGTGILSKNCLNVRFTSNGKEYSASICFKRDLHGFGISHYICLSTDPLDIITQGGGNG